MSRGMSLLNDGVDSFSHDTLKLSSGMAELAFVQQHIIRHPRFQQLHQRITQCILTTAEFAEPECLCLVGATGVGKTTLVRSFAASYPRYETSMGSRCPVLYLETPHPVTVKGMTSALLDALGDPRAFKGTQPQMNARLQRYLADCQVRLVILDDFHHLIDLQTDRILRTVSEWLKVLIKNTGIVYLVVGIEGQVERILDTNSQLSRLFIRERLPAFTWQQSKPETIHAFAKLVGYVLNSLNLSLTESEPQAVLHWRIHQATDGVMSHLVNLFRHARIIHSQRKLGLQPLTLAVLAEAYRLRLQHHIGRQNPFLLPFPAPPQTDSK